LANCGNLKLPDLNFTDFGENTLNFTDFGLKKQVLAMFNLLFVRKKIFHPNLRRGSPEKMFSGKFFLPSPPARQHFWGKYGKIYGKIGENWKNMAPW
jgi:hypothetical protein